MLISQSRKSFSIFNNEILSRIFIKEKERLLHTSNKDISWHGFCKKNPNIDRYNRVEDYTSKENINPITEFERVSLIIPWQLAS